jgi:hypothetical protein
MMKSCSYCSQPAQYSLTVLLSTVGVSSREQQSSRVVLFCNDCLQELCESECWGTEDIQRAVNNAYTTLIQRLRARSSRTNSSTE